MCSWHQSPPPSVPHREPWPQQGHRLFRAGHTCLGRRTVSGNMESDPAPAPPGTGCGLGSVQTASYSSQGQAVQTVKLPCTPPSSRASSEPMPSVSPQTADAGRPCIRDLPNLPEGLGQRLGGLDAFNESCLFWSKPRSKETMSWAGASSPGPPASASLCRPDPQAAGEGDF